MSIADPPVHCEECGRVFRLSELDAKPARLAGRANTSAEVLWAAFEANEDFDRLECRGCYGPGYSDGGRS
jgi:hypothetical protein